VAELSSLATKKKCILTCNVVQTIILIHFNRGDCYTYKELQDSILVEDRELGQALRFLCNPKNKLLLKQDISKPVFKPEETVKPNPDYSSQNIKVSFVPIQQSKRVSTEKTEGEKTDEAEIKQERQFIIDATIVRIMKAHKTEKYTELMAQVMKNITLFKPQPQMIKH